MRVDIPNIPECEQQSGQCGAVYYSDSIWVKNIYINFITLFQEELE